jgi:hypothetical protein
MQSLQDSIHRCSLVNSSQGSALRLRAAAAKALGLEPGKQALLADGSEQHPVLAGQLAWL